MSPPRRRTDAAKRQQEADAAGAPMLLSERGPLALPKWGCEEVHRGLPPQSARF